MAEHMMELQQQVRQNNDELQDFLRDLGSWTKEMEMKDDQLKKKKEEACKGCKKSEPLRTVDELKRKSTDTISSEKENTKEDPEDTDAEKKKTRVAFEEPKLIEMPKRISSFDYDAWSKFDVEKALEEIPSANLVVDDDEMDEGMRLQRAIVEKDRGNEHFKKGRYKEAIGHYTRGIQCDQKNAVLPANRAMAHLKVNQWDAAESDSTLALSLDPSYVKAYQRRATARKSLKRFEKALEDFNKVLELEPNSKSAQADIEEVLILMRSVDVPKLPVNEEQKKGVKFEDNLKAAFGTVVNKVPEPAIPGQVFPINKSPHTRCLAPLKKLVITEVGDDDEEIDSSIVIPGQAKSSEMSGKIIEVIEPNATAAAAVMEAEDYIEEAVYQPDGAGTKSKGLMKIVEKQINDNSIAPTVSVAAKGKLKLKKPKSSVQFTTTWSKLSNQPAKSAFLCLFTPKDYPLIFKHSLEPHVFSSIVNTLLAMEKISPHLLGLSRIPRISAMIMFLDANEQKKISKLVATSTQENVLTTADMKELHKCFGP